MIKAASGIMLHIDSDDLHSIRFFPENKVESLLILNRLLFLSRLMAVFFPLSDLTGTAIS
jgi:hypothetical protein